ncbi:hypothetical protein FB451DRAFT_1437393 [Mycena latifolia]|nr:hypothetical protein FB451DRAFT_1437393 [Mycena latifolia]
MAFIAQLEQPNFLQLQSQRKRIFSRFAREEPQKAISELRRPVGIRRDKERFGHPGTSADSDQPASTSHRLLPPTTAWALRISAPPRRPHSISSKNALALTPWAGTRFSSVAAVFPSHLGGVPWRRNAGGERASSWRIVCFTPFGRTVDGRVQFPLRLFLDLRPWSVLRSSSRIQKSLVIKHWGAASELMRTLPPCALLPP